MGGGGCRITYSWGYHSPKTYRPEWRRDWLRLDAFVEVLSTVKLGLLANLLRVAFCICSFLIGIIAVYCCCCCFLCWSCILACSEVGVLLAGIVKLWPNPKEVSLIHAINTTPEENCAGKVETRKYIFGYAIIVDNTYLRKPTSYCNYIYPFIHVWFSQYILFEFCEISHCVPPNIPPRWRC